MVNECIEQNKKQVPLLKVVRASIIDKYGNISELQQLHSFWAARGLKKLQTEVLKVGKTKVLLRVNRSTMTAALPLDFGEDLFVGYIDGGRKISMSISDRLVDSGNIQQIDYEDKCSSCGQDKNICEDLAITEDVQLVVINDSTYENKTIKKLYPNGDYYLEKSIWFKNVETGDAELAPVEKKFITKFALKPCGCLDQTDENIEKVRTNCYDFYCCNYSKSCDQSSSYKYSIFEDTGLIGVEYNYPYDFIYLEYLGFMTKRNGQYMVPEVAFECLVEWTKWKSIKDKNGAERWRIRDTWDDYVREYKMMVKILTRTSISSIISRLRSIPKLNLEYDNSWYSCFDKSALSRAASEARYLPSSSSAASGGSSSSTVVNQTTIINNASYQLAVKTGNGVGHPVNDTASYQNAVLEKATDVNYIILAKQILSKLDNDFTFEASTGTIYLTSMRFYTPDSLIIPYNKKS